jgi:holo-[acyl-carrier protein] synthase
MIYGIGVDLVNVRRIEKVIHRWGTRFLERIFTSQEIEVCSQRPNSASALALRFAAKEAFAKALGLGMRKGIKWRDIEVVHNAYGRPDLNVTGNALNFCREEGIVRWFVTLSDESGHGVAVVVLEKGDPT